MAWRSASGSSTGGAQIWLRPGSSRKTPPSICTAWRSPLTAGIWPSSRSDRQVSIYDTETGRRRQHLAMKVMPSDLAFHPCGDTLAVACGPEVLLFDVATGRERSRLRHPDPIAVISHLAWHPDGRRQALACHHRKNNHWDTDASREVMPPWGGPYQSRHPNGVQPRRRPPGDRRF